ncbi:hypothetical protein JTE90_000386 [Oedothorax gibbosus]|uniref:Uncharacterized protein n=1 Tax=Oedothorax gibbosus TaxID=931172 RepID=A0AAV6TVL6_9ARAC|nr:hypothetical protein JTE90_000386 [Oedothorax gibbosus]
MCLIVQRHIGVWWIPMLKRWGWVGEIARDLVLLSLRHALTVTSETILGAMALFAALLTIELLSADFCGVTYVVAELAN